MVTFRKIVVSVAALVPIIAALPATYSIAQRDDLDGRYIITFKRGVAADDVTSHLDYARDLHSRSLERRGLTKRDEEGIRKRFEFNEHRSYSAIFDAETLGAIARHPAVEAVEPDVISSIDTKTKVPHDEFSIDSKTKVPHDEFSIDSKEKVPHDEFSIDSEPGLHARLSTDVITQKDATWGLSSVSLSHTGAKANAVKQYRYWSDGQGQGVWVYVVDSGIRDTHKDFEGRVINGANFVNNETFKDWNGHGTHVAGTIGSKTYGVAKKVNLIAVKVIHAGGKTSSEDLLGAYQWVHDDAKARNRIPKSIVNISIGGPSAKYYSDAMEALHKAGITVVVSAGNNNKDASTQSPANTPNIFTVASITNDDARSAFSNFGTVVDLFAPGSDIASLGSTSDSAVKTLSGTSMSTPHVAGMAATLKSRFGTAMDRPLSVYEMMISLSIKGVVKDPKGTPNRILSNGLGSTKY